VYEGGVRSLSERWLARAIVAVVVLCNAAALAPELDVARVDLNDNVFHYTIASRLVERIAAHRQALDFWMPEWSFGYPVVRDYQPLAHWLVALAHFATFQQFPFDALFAFVRWLLLAIFPLTVYAACRWSGMRPLTSAAAALLAPLIAATNFYGIDYGSYVWRGNGLFTQLVAMHLFVLAVGAGCGAIRLGRGATLAGLLLGLTFLAHFIYGYMGAATLILAALIHADRRRLARLIWIGAVSVVVAAFQIVPMLGDGPFINKSRWEPAWKWDSFGLTEVAGMTASGNLLDTNRIPVLSLLALIGAITIVRRKTRSEEEVFALAGTGLWLFLFCGRAAWGPLFNAIGLSDAAQVHRFVGGAQWFLLLLAAYGLTRIWEMRRRVAAIAVTALLLWPAVAERGQFLRENEEWGRANLASLDSNRDALERTIAAARAAGGRSFPGLAASWGGQVRIGYVPLYAFLSEAHVPAVAFLYHAMALPADVMVRFDETRPDHYRLFDVRSVVTDAGRQLPPFLRPAGSAGPFTILRPPPSGAFDLVQAPRSIFVDRRTFYDVNDLWLQSTWPAAGAHLLLEYETAVGAEAMPPRLPSLEALKQPQRPVACGTVVKESDGDDVYRAEVNAAGDCYALLKMTYHPNWRATVDGAPRPSVMLSPGFVAVRVGPGHHVVELRYAPGAAKPLLLLLAVPLLVAGFVAEKRGALANVEARAETLPLRASYGLLVAALVLPVIVGVAGSAQPNGHDALEYLPRVIEFHESVRHGILFPRWAPDLSSGQGQPLFLFNPPLFYYLAELFHLLGLSFVAAMNAACVLLIAASAATMYWLGRWFFGAAGGALAAAAYIYAPYFLVDLYVRTAFAEFSAFPFYPLALYGFARHATEGKRRYLILGVVGYAGVWFAHSPAALLFSPLLGAFLLFLAWRERSWRLLATHLAACAVALLIAACVWLPAAAEAGDTHANLLVEGPLKYSNHFVYPKQFFANAWGYGVSIPGDQDGMPFSLGWAQLLLAAIAAVAVARWETDAWKRWTAFFAGAAFVLCFLMTQRAHAVWESVRHIQYVAFPWRLLASTTCCLALLAAAVTLALARLPERWRGAAYAACMAAIVLSGVAHAKPASYLSIDLRQWTPHEIAAHGVIPATFDTFEPRWVNERPVYRGDAPLVTRGAAATSVVRRYPDTYVASVRAQSECDVDLPVAYFPGWHLKLDGVEQPADNVTPMGRMRLTVAAGTHTIEATFERTPLRLSADIISLAALLLTALFAMAHRRR
jgi:hypothetical protein